MFIHSRAWYALEAMLLTRKPHIGPLNSVTTAVLERIGSSGWSTLVFWALLSMTGFPVHITLQILRKNVVNKLNLLKMSSFLSRNALLDLYFKIILLSVLYGLAIWGGFPNADLLHSLEVIHRRATIIMYNLPRDIPTEEVYRCSNWNTLIFYYKLFALRTTSEEVIT